MERGLLGAKPTLRGLARGALAALLAAAAGCGGGEGRPQRIVLVTLDTVRQDALAHMPHTAALAAAGTSFRDFWASTATTQPTHASLLTGLHPWDHGVTRNAVVLEERFETLAETLGGAGWSTAAVVASFPLERRFGLAQGFDVYDDAFDTPYVSLWEKETVEGNFYSLAPSVTARALELLAAEGEARQFFWFHYFDPHDPYGDAAALPPAQWTDIAVLLRAAAGRDPAIDERVAAARAVYDRDCAALDRELGRLYDALAEDGRYETHLFVTADHGESFGELGCLGHGKRMTREQLHVPLICRSPAMAPGVRSDTAGSVDVTTTILARAGLVAGERPGRDLAAGVPEGAAASGMRRGEKRPGETECLVDGRELAVGGPGFFVARSGRLVTGDARRLVADDDPAREVVDEAPVRELFGRLERRLASGSARVLSDPEIDGTLKALGYY